MQKYHKYWFVSPLQNPQQGNWFHILDAWQNTEKTQIFTNSRTQF